MRTFILTLVTCILIYSCQKKENDAISKNEAIAEAVKLKLTAKNDVSANVEAISIENNYDYNEIDFKSNLGQYFGSRGLNKIAKPNIEEFSKQIQGIWKLDNRHVSGELVNSNEWIINKPLRPENYETIESLTLNQEPDANNDDKLLGVYGIISLKIIHGPQNGLPKGTSGILQVFDYSLLGHNFKGFNGKHKGLAEFVWVKQNGEYRAVIGSIKVTDMDSNIIMNDDSNCIVLNANPNSYTIQYPNIEGFDSYHKIRDDTDFEINEAWDKMNNDIQFINPLKWDIHLRK